MKKRLYWLTSILNWLIAVILLKSTSPSITVLYYDHSSIYLRSIVKSIQIVEFFVINPMWSGSHSIFRVHSWQIIFESVIWLQLYMWTNNHQRIKYPHWYVSIKLDFWIKEYDSLCFVELNKHSRYVFEKMRLFLRENFIVLPRIASIVTISLEISFSSSSHTRWRKISTTWSLVN